METLGSLYPPVSTLQANHCRCCLFSVLVERVKMSRAVSVLVVAVGVRSRQWISPLLLLRQDLPPRPDLDRFLSHQAYWLLHQRMLYRPAQPLRCRCLRLQNQNPDQQRLQSGCRRWYLSWNYRFHGWTFYQNLKNNRSMCQPRQRFCPARF